MTGFSIGFTGETDPDDELVAIGEIWLGEEREEFQAVTGYWSCDDYRASWATALRRLLDGADVSCLITSLTDPIGANFVWTRPLYRDGEAVHVQERVVILDDIAEPFDERAPWDSVDPRRTFDDERRPITEWHITLTDIENFLDPDIQVR